MDILRSKDYRNYLIVFIIFCAVLSDVLRIPGTSVTIFRLFLPVGIVLIATVPSLFVKMIGVAGGFFAITSLQYFVFYKYLYVEYEFSLELLLKNIFLYLSVIILFFLVKLYQQINGEIFYIKFYNLIITLGLVLFIFAVLGFILNINGITSVIDNPNNYGCYLAAIIPFLFIRYCNIREQKKYLLFILAIVIVIYLNDSKAVLFGIAIQLLLMIAIIPNYKTKNIILIRTLIPMCFILIIGILLYLDIHIHEYSLRNILLESIIRIVNNEPYPVYTSSASFRVNTTIFALQILLNTYGIGLGIGNLGILLKNEFPSIDSGYTMALNSPTLSLHNAWLEMMLDIGTFVIILICTFIIYFIKLYFSHKKLTDLEKVRLIFGISFPIWIISSSGIITMYYIWIIIAFLLFCRHSSKKYLIIDFKK